jgi:hypothetical protein
MHRPLIDQLTRVDHCRSAEFQKANVELGCRAGRFSRCPYCRILHPRRQLLARSFFILVASYCRVFIWVFEYTRQFSIRSPK